MASDGKLIFDTKLDTSGFDSGVKGLAGKAKAVGSGISGIANMTKNAVVAGTKTMVAGLGAFGAYSIKAGADFDAGMSEVQAISGASGKDLEALRSKAKEMGATTKFSATQSAEALKYMAMAGWKSEQMIEGLPGIMNLAAASGEDLALVSDIVTDSLTAFGMKAEDTGRFVDVLAAASSNSNTNVSMLGESFKYAAPIAGALGYTAEDTALALGLMANAGIKSSQAGTTLRGALTRLAKPTGEVKDQMDALGIAITDSQGNMLPFRDVMVNLREAFANLTEEQQAQAATTLFGKNAMSGMLAVINASDEDFNKLADAIDNSKGSAEAMAKVMNDNLKGDFTIMMSALEGLGISLYENLDKPFRSIVQNVTKQLDVLNQAVQNDIGSIPEILGNMIADGAVAIASKAPMMINTASEVLLAFINGLDYNQDKLADSAVTIITTLTNSILEVGGRLLEVGGSLVLKIAQGLADNADTIAPKALEVVGKLSDGFMKALPKLWDIGKELVKNVAKGLKDNPEVVAEAVPAILKAFATAMLLFQGADVAKGLLKSLASGLIGNGGMMQEPAKGILGHLTKAFNGGSSKLVTTGKGLLGKLTEGFSKTTAPLIKAGKDTVDYLGIAILEGKDKLLAPAKGLVDVVGNTISKVGNSSLAQSGLGLVTKIGTGITSGFGKITALAGKIVPLMTAVLSNPVGLVVAGSLLIGAIVKGFDVDVPKLTHSAGEIVGKIVGTISNRAEKLVGVGKSLIGKIGEGWDSLKDTFADIKANGLINTLGEKFKSGIDVMKQAGSNFIQGIKDGWDSRKGEVTEETSQLPNEVNDSIDPTATQQTGNDMIEGIIEGLKWGRTSVSEAYRELINNGVSESDAKAVLRQEGSLSVQEYAQGILEASGSAREAYAVLRSEGLGTMDAAEQFFEIGGANIDAFVGGNEEGGITYREKLQQMMDDGYSEVEAIEKLYQIAQENMQGFAEGTQAGSESVSQAYKGLIDAGYSQLEAFDQMYQKGQLNVDAFGQGTEAGKENIRAIFNGLVQAGLTEAEAFEQLQQIGLMNAQGYANGTGEGQIDVQTAMKSLMEAGLTEVEASEIMGQAGKSNVDAYVSGVNSSEGAVSGAYDSAFAKPFSLLDFFLGDPTQREGRKTGEKYATGIGESKETVKTEAQGVMQSAEQAFTQETQAQAQGQKIGNEFASGITSSKTGVETASKGVGTSAYNGLNNQSDKFRGAGDKSMSAYAQGLGQQKGNVINSVNDMGNQINNSLNKTSNQSSQTASQMMNKISSSVNKGSSQVTQAVSQMSNKVNSEVKKMGSQAQQSSTDMMNKMSQAVKTGTNKINQDFKQMSTQITSTIKNTSSQVTSSGKQMMSQFTSSIKSGANNSVSAIRNMGSRMVSSVNSYRGQFQSAGYNLMAGLRVGINSGSSGVINAAISVMNRAVAAAKRVASIHSPSRVWRDEIGEMLPLGMAEGIRKMSSKAEIEAVKMMDNVRGVASAEVDVNLASNSKANSKRISNTAKYVSDEFARSISDASAYTGQQVSSTLIGASESIKGQALEDIGTLTDETTDTLTNKITISADQVAGYTSQTIDELSKKTTNSVGNDLTNANNYIGNHAVNLIGSLSQKTINVVTNELVKSANVIAGTVTKVIQDLSRQVNDLIANYDRAMARIDADSGSTVSNNPKEIADALQSKGKKLSDAQLKKINDLSKRNLEIIDKLRKVEESKRPLSNAQLDNLEKLNKKNVEIADKLKDINTKQDKNDELPVLKYDSSNLDDVFKDNLQSTDKKLSDEQLKKINDLSERNLEIISDLRKIEEDKRPLSNIQLAGLRALNKRNIDVVNKLKDINDSQEDRVDTNPIKISKAEKALLDLKNGQDEVIDLVDDAPYKMKKASTSSVGVGHSNSKLTDIMSTMPQDIAEELDKNKEVAEIKSKVPLSDDQLRKIKLLSDDNLDAIEELKRIDEDNRNLSNAQLDKLEKLNTRNTDIVRELQKIQRAEKNLDYDKLMDKAMIATKQSVLKNMSDKNMSSSEFTISGFNGGKTDNKVYIENGDLTTIIELDGREVGRAVTPMVSQEISKERRRRQ